MMTGTGVDLFGIWARNGQVLAVGAAGTLVQSAGSSWVSQSLPAAGGKTLRAIWGTVGNALWLVGDGGTLLAWDGTSALAVNTGISDTLRAIWGSAADDVWAVGDGGRVLHYDGSAWSVHVQGSALTKQSLLAVGGPSRKAVYAVGDGGVLLFYDGTMWRQQDGGTQRRLSGIAALPDGDVWFVGPGASILRSRNVSSGSP